jgi:ABC-type multidrug transport system ATPase subunit
MVVTTQHLTKHYGRIRAVEDLNLEIPEKSVFGILGPNGSGKTTTLGMLLDVVNPTSGSYSWFGKEFGRNGRQIGSLLETPAFYPYLSAVDNLRIIAEIKGIGYDNIEPVLTRVGLFDRRHSHYRTFSLGMKQRLALAAALLSDPQVLILDEPTNGLDPKGIAEIRELIRNIAAGGKTIILASHLLDEVQKVCTHFAVLDKGKLLHSGPVNPAAETEHSVELAAADLEKLQEALKSFPEITGMRTEQDKITVTLPATVAVGELSRFLAEKGVWLTHLVALRKSLESQFLEIVNHS